MHTHTSCATLISKCDSLLPSIASSNFPHRCAEHSPPVCTRICVQMYMSVFVIMLSMRVCARVHVLFIYVTFVLAHKQSSQTVKDRNVGLKWNEQVFVVSQKHINKHIQAVHATWQHQLTYTLKSCVYMHASIHATAPASKR